MGTISNIEIVDPAWTDFLVRRLNNPQPSVNWFEEEAAVAGVRGENLGWFLAQGYVVKEVVDDDANPPGQLFTIQRTKLKNKEVLDDLVTDYINAYNDAKTINDRRYDDIMVMFGDILLKTHSHLNRMSILNNDYNVMYINHLDDVQSDIDDLLNETKASAVTTFDQAASALNAYATKLAELGTGYDEYVSEIETILSNRQTDLATFESRAATIISQLTTDYSNHDAAVTALESVEDSQAASHITNYEAKVDELEATVTSAETQLLALVAEMDVSIATYRTQALAIITNISSELGSLDSTISSELTALTTAIGSHKTTHAGLVDLFLSDYTSHETTTRALLTGLGATELARINEQFDNLQAKSEQNLTDRGLYSSSLVTQVTARVERERSEAITALNDRLAREKTDHEHQLFGEKTNARQAKVTGEEYQFQLTKLGIDVRAMWAEKLYSLAVDAQKIYLSIRASIHDAEKTAIAQEGAIRERVTGWRLDAKKMTADAKAQVYAIRSSITRWKTDSEFKLANVLRTIRSVNLEIYSKELTASLDIEAFAAKARESIVSKLNEYILAHAEGLSRYAASTVRNGEFLAGVRQRATAQAMMTRFRFADSINDVDQRQQRLLGYQLDARNNLAIGMFGFAERRVDSYPDLDKMGRLAMGLGDAGSTQWISE